MLRFRYHQKRAAILNSLFTYVSWEWGRNCTQLSLKHSARFPAWDSWDRELISGELAGPDTFESRFFARKNFKAKLNIPNLASFSFNFYLKFSRPFRKAFCLSLIFVFRNNIDNIVFCRLSQICICPCHDVFHKEIPGMISSTVTQYFNWEGRRALKICEAYNGNKSGATSRVNAMIGILLDLSLSRGSQII